MRKAENMTKNPQLMTNFVHYLSASFGVIWKMQ